MKWAFLENLETHLIRRWASQGWQNKDMAVEVALDRRRVSCGAGVSCKAA